MYVFIESWTNILNVVLAGVVIWIAVGSKAKGATKTAVMYLLWAGVILGAAEIIDLLQLFPDGTFMADLIYEKEIPVLVLLILAIKGLKGKK